MGIKAAWVKKRNAMRMGSWFGALLSLSVGAGLYVSTSQAIEKARRLDMTTVRIWIKRRGCVGESGKLGFTTRSR